MKMKIGHAVCVMLLIVVGLYVFHMMTGHQGQGLMPNLGTK
jgi:hypothetical protein